jgi:uncharacterized protein
MSNLNKWHGKTALITGASSGIGAAFARRLAAAGCNVVITARRKDLLEKLAVELEAKYGISAKVVVADLSEAGGAKSLFESVRELGEPIQLLINNAGYGASGDFAKSDLEQLLQMIRLNVLASVELTGLFLPTMIERGTGDILFVASIAGCFPAPAFACYGGTKAFLKNFGEAIGWELRGTDVKISVISPGAIDTEFLEVAGMSRPRLSSIMLMTPEQVAERGLNIMAAGRLSVVIGFFNKIFTLGLHFLPLRPRLLAASAVKVLYNIK